MDPLHTLVPAALARLLGDAPFSLEKLQFAWNVAVGPALARVTAVTLEADGRLRVRAAGPLWRREVERALPVIRERLEIFLGRSAPSAIVLECDGG